MYVERFYKVGVVALLFVAGVNSSTAADIWVGSVTIARIRIHPFGTFFGVTNLPAPTDVCSNGGEQFRFDHTTTHGKSMLAMLLTAKVSGKPVDLWYSPSTAPGKNEATGCNDSTTSMLSGVALSR